MRRLLASLCLLLCALPGRAGDTTPAVSFIEVIANPEKYDGKQIQVFGYVELGPEGSAVYFHKEDCDNALGTNALALYYHSIPDYKADPKGFERRLSDKYDLIDGTFVAKQVNNMWRGRIINITRFSVWSDPSTPAPAGVSRKAAPAGGVSRSRVARNSSQAARVGTSAAVCAGELDVVRFDKNRNVLRMPLGLIRRTYFPPQAPAPTEIKAASLKAYSVAWAALESAPEIPRAKKNLDRYLAVYVSEDANDYYVYFLPKQRYPIVHGRETVMDGVTFFGQQALYVIRKGDYKIVKRYLYLL